MANNLTLLERERHVLNLPASVLDWKVELTRPSHGIDDRGGEHFSVGEISPPVAVDGVHAIDRERQIGILTACDVDLVRWLKFVNHERRTT